RPMYMQVYLHKTVLSADHLLRHIFKRVRLLMENGAPLHHTSPSLQYFLERRGSMTANLSQEVVTNYLKLDDSDIFQSIKYWQHNDDSILSNMCGRFQSRQLFRTTFIENRDFQKVTDRVKAQTMKILKKR